MLRGAAAIVFALLALAWPAVTLLFLVVLFAAYAVATGAVTLYGALRNRGERGWWLAALLGVLSIAAGVVAYFNPDVTVLALILVMGVYAVASGALDIVMAIRLRREMTGEWLLALAGVLSVVFGGLVLAVPAAGAFALVVLVGFYALAHGVLLVALGVRMRSGTAHAAPDANRSSGGRYA